LPRAIVLGGYGLIGSACMRALAAGGFSVAGIGRSQRIAARVLPDADWIIRDIARLTEEEWRDLLAGADVVVNAAGALQDGGRDDLAAIHETAVARILAALAGSSTRLVQISAAGVSTETSTEFFRSKARGDALIRASALDWVILRPVLVISPAAYGGTALLRAAAAMPWVLPVVLPRTCIQTVFIDDLTSAVLHAARRGVPSGTVADLAEAETHSLPEILRCIRRWQGFAEPKLELHVPDAMLAPVTRLADLAGRFGWRSPLRTSALQVLRDGVAGDPASWTQAGGPPCRNLMQSLAAIPATLQERWFARLYAAFPMLVVLLSAFWIASGVIGLARWDAAATVLTTRGFPTGPAHTAVVAGGLIDMALGLAILWRPLVRHACLGMAALSLAYLASATVLAPDLWADPLGPLVKVLPGVALALVTLALADDR
jgi:uncharacterized protein YbjT (DUF2867 family)